jgi:SpoVK/Ycf46/Vps4 family AAA+-type ATPase
LAEVFKNAISEKNPIIFIDEIDGLLEERLDGMNNSFIAQFKTITDGVGSNPNGYTIIAATNYPWNLSKAVLSRFVLIYVPPPNSESRAEIFRHNLHTNISMPSNITPDEYISLGKLSDGYSGRYIYKVCKSVFKTAVGKLRKAKKFIRDDSKDFIPCNGCEICDNDVELKSCVNCKAQSMTFEDIVAEKRKIQPITLQDVIDSLGTIQAISVQEYEDFAKGNYRAQTKLW